MDDIPSPLTWEAVLNAKTQLSVVIAINKRVFVKNTSGQDQTLPAGTVIAGWFKGKFWHYRRDGSGEPHTKKNKKAAEEEITEVTDADVLFSLKDADQMVALNGKSAKLFDLVTEKRKTHPDASVQYHKLQDKPGPGNPGWFTLQTEVQIYFRGPPKLLRKVCQRLFCTTWPGASRPVPGRQWLPMSPGLSSGAKQLGKV